MDKSFSKKNLCFVFTFQGDTRAVACVMGLVKALSSDHNTGNPKERERVYAMGGTIKDNRLLHFLLSF